MSANIDMLCHFCRYIAVLNACMKASFLEPMAILNIRLTNANQHCQICCSPKVVGDGKLDVSRSQFAMTSFLALELMARVFQLVT